MDLFTKSRSSSCVYPPNSSCSNRNLRAPTSRWKCPLMLKTLVCKWVMSVVIKTSGLQCTWTIVGMVHHLPMICVIIIGNKEYPLMVQVGIVHHFYCHSELETSQHGPNSYLRWGPWPSADPQGSPYYNGQEQECELEQEPHHAEGILKDFFNQKANKLRKLPENDQGAMGTHNGIEDDTITVQPTWTKPMSWDYGTVSKWLKALSNPSPQHDGITLVQPLDYS